MKRLALLLVLGLFACSDDGDATNNAKQNNENNQTDSGVDMPGTDMSEDMAPQPRPYPEPDAWPANEGPGAGNVAFTADQLDEHCAYLDGGEQDLDKHNMVAMWNGYMVMPWANDFGQGGVTFFDVSDPCSPVSVGGGFDMQMRETHSMTFAKRDGTTWMVTASIENLLTGGILFWDISDVTAPSVASRLNVEGFGFGDAYRRVTFSHQWAGNIVYVASAQSGIHIVDATDPANPEVVNQFRFEPIAQIGQLQVIGNLLVATTAEGTRAILLDVSDPVNPQPIPGGDFVAMDAEGTPREAYFTTTTGGYLYFARKDSGGGLIIYDIKDPTNPTRVGGVGGDGSGGYVFIKDDLAFVGEGNHASVFDISDKANPTEVRRLDLEGDLDTVTPMTNFIVLAVDDEATRDEGSAIVPFWEEPDTKAPEVSWAWPADGAQNLALTSKVGVTFSELIEPGSAWEGSVRLYETDTDPAMTRVDGFIDAQETIVNFTPFEPLKPGTSYTLEIPVGGIADYAGNAIQSAFTLTFETVGE